jgi:hypothetical protein
VEQEVRSSIAAALDLPVRLCRGRVTEVRQKISFLLGLLVGAALIEAFRRGRRSQRHEVHDPRTEELRRRLAEQRARPAEPTPEAAPAVSAATPRLEPPASEGSGDRRDLAADRRRIYEEGRAAVHEMRRSAEPPEASE